MSIVCGIDFSPSSLLAAAVAGRLAARLGTELKLVHVVEVQEQAAPWRQELTDASRLALNRELETLRANGVSAQAHLLEGRPDEAITEFARSQGAKLIVIAALGSRSADAWQVGGSADRIVQLAPAPVLVVREPTGLMEWLEGKRALKITLALDRTEASRMAAAFAGELRRAGPCDLDVVHLYWAPEEFQRLGFSGVRSIVDPDPDVERILRDELRGMVGDLPGEGAVRFHVELVMGRPSDRVVTLAQQHAADLVVVGSHRRSLVDRLWSGSVSRAVLHGAPMSVACVASVARAVTKVPELRRVLVATDFSETGDAAIGWAYGLLQRGGEVHLLTVHTPSAKPPAYVARDLFSGPFAPEDQVAVQQLKSRLQALEPDGIRERGITTDAHAVVASRESEAICQAAERLGVDAVVLGTHGRGRIARAVVGSVAQAVAARCKRPVLLVHPPEVEEQDGRTGR